MNFKTVKERKILYPASINFKPMAIGLGVGLALAFSGCASNQPKHNTKIVEAKTLPDSDKNITEPERLGGVPPVMPNPDENRVIRGDIVHPSPPILPELPKKE